VVFTKQEIKKLFKDSCGNLLFDDKALSEHMLQIMDWSDDEPRDITSQDVDFLADIIAKDADSILTNLEKLTCDKEQNKTYT